MCPKDKTVTVSWVQVLVKPPVRPGCNNPAAPWKARTEVIGGCGSWPFQAEKRSNNTECSRSYTVNSWVLLLQINTSDKVPNEHREALPSSLHRISYFCHTHILVYSVRQLCENSAFLLNRFALYHSQICWLNGNSKLFYCFIILLRERARSYIQLFTRQNWLLKSREESYSV